MGFDALIIGADGQDGTLLWKKLSTQGKQVIRVHRPGKSIVSNQNCLDVAINCNDLSDVSTLIDRYRPKKIFQLAGINPSSEIDQSDLQLRQSMFEAHFQITKNVILASSKFESQIIVALSSKMFQLKNSTDYYVDENSAPNPDTYYGATKNQCWDLIKTYRENYNVPISGAILFNHVGYRAHKSFLMEKVIDQLVGYQKNHFRQFEFNDWSARIDISHALDIVDGLLAIADLNSSSDFVLGSGSAISVRDLVVNSLRSLQKSPNLDLQVLGIPREIAFQAALVANTSKAREVLGWNIKRNVVDFIRNEVESTAYLG